MYSLPSATVGVKKSPKSHESFSSASYFQLTLPCFLIEVVDYAVVCTKVNIVFPDCCRRVYSTSIANVTDRVTTTLTVSGLEPEKIYYFTVRVWNTKRKYTDSELSTETERSLTPI